jgi:hypothetical protein
MATYIISGETATNGFHHKLGTIKWAMLLVTGSLLLHGGQAGLIFSLAAKTTIPSGTDGGMDYNGTIGNLSRAMLVANLLQ